MVIIKNNKPPRLNSVEFLFSLFLCQPNKNLISLMSDADTTNSKGRIRFLALGTCVKLNCPGRTVSEVESQLRTKYLTPVSFGTCVSDFSCLCVWNLYTASFCLDNKPESVCST